MRPEIPGFYYDESKKRYFKVVRGGGSTSAVTKFSTGEIAKRKREELRSQRRAKTAVPRYSRHAHALAKRAGVVTAAAGPLPIERVQVLRHCKTWWVSRWVNGISVVGPCRVVLDETPTPIDLRSAQVWNSASLSQPAYVLRTAEDEQLDQTSFAAGQHGALLKTCTGAHHGGSTVMFRAAVSGAPDTADQLLANTHIIQVKGRNVWAAASTFSARTPHSGRSSSNNNNSHSDSDNKSCAVVHGADNVLHASQNCQRSFAKHTFNSDIVALAVADTRTSTGVVVGLRNGTVHICLYRSGCETSPQPRISVVESFDFGSRITRLGLSASNLLVVCGLEDRMAVYDVRDCFAGRRTGASVSSVSQRTRRVRCEFQGYRNTAQDRHGLAVGNHFCAVANDDGSVSVFEITTGRDVSPPKLNRTSDNLPADRRPTLAKCVALDEHPDRIDLYILRNKTLELWSTSLF